MKKYCLNKLELEKEGIIEKIECDDAVKRRLMDLGLVNGTKIIPILQSPLKNPKAYLIRGAIIAIRNEDAKNIKIKV